jgi:putative glutamine amidotransferase
VHDIPGRLSHRSPKDPDLDVNYGPRHGVTLTEGGLLHGLAGSREVMVNSLHRQAIDNLAPGLTVEAVAEDGTIEAVRVEAATAFALGVQWHPEYKVLNDPFSVAIFRAFGQAARERMLERSRWLTAPQAAK